MTTMAVRYRELAPGAYLTLMSMIEAIALENLVSRGQELGASIGFGAEAAAVWLAWLLTLQVIALTWVTNAQGFMAFRWRPGVDDFLIPFGGGLLQFVAIGFIGPASMAPFLLLVGFSSLSFAALLRWLFSFENEDMAEFAGTLWQPGLYGSTVLCSAFGLVGGSLVLLGVAGPILCAVLLAAWNAAMLAILVIWLRAWARCVVPDPAE